MIVGTRAPEFNVESVSEGDVSATSLIDYAGRWLLLIFYPADFGYVAATELLAFSDRLAEFDDRLVEVAGMSTDSVFSHLAWMDLPRRQGGISGLKFPLLADPSHATCEAFGLLSADGVALPGTFLIDPEGVVQFCVVNNIGVGRCVDPVLQVIDAVRFAQSEDVVIPAGWVPGQAGITPDWRESKFWFEASDKQADAAVGDYGQMAEEGTSYGEQPER